MRQDKPANARKKYSHLSPNRSCTRSAHCVIAKRKGNPLWLPNHRASTYRPLRTHLADIVLPVMGFKVRITYVILPYHHGGEMLPYF